MSFPISSLTNNPTLQSLKLAMDASVTRHAAISSNLANINTPNYQRLDVSADFKTHFAEALNQLQQGETPTELPKPTLVQDKTPLATRFDGNNVNLDSEVVNLMNNQSYEEFTARVLTDNYTSLHAAIAGRVS